MELGAIFARRGQDQRSLEHLEAAVHYVAERVEIYQVLAERALDRGDADTALKVLHLAQSLDEDDARTWLLFSRIYGATGAEKDRLAALSRACVLGVVHACR
jgi:predicted Zn-dependent protease